MSTRQSSKPALRPWPRNGTSVCAASPMRLSQPPCTQGAHPRAEQWGRGAVEEVVRGILEIDGEVAAASREEVLEGVAIAERGERDVALRRHEDRDREAAVAVREADDHAVAPGPEVQRVRCVREVAGPGRGDLELPVGDGRQALVEAEVGVPQQAPPDGGERAVRGQHAARLELEGCARRRRERERAALDVHGVAAVAEVHAGCCRAPRSGRAAASSARTVRRRRSRRHSACTSGTAAGHPPRGSSGRPGGGRWPARRLDPRCAERLPPTLGEREIDGPPAGQGVDAGVGARLEHGDVVALLGEQHRQQETDGAGADDRDVTRGGGTQGAGYVRLLGRRAALGDLRRAGDPAAL